MVGADDDALGGGDGAGDDGGPVEVVRVGVPGDMTMLEELMDAEGDILKKLDGGGGMLVGSRLVNVAASEGVGETP